MARCTQVLAGLATHRLYSSVVENVPPLYYCQAPSWVLHCIALLVDRLATLSCPVLCAPQTAASGAGRPPRCASGTGLRQIQTQPGRRAAAASSASR